MPRYDGNTRHVTKGQRRRQASINMRRWMAKLEKLKARLEKQHASVEQAESEEMKEWEAVKRATGWGVKPLSAQPYLSPRQSGTHRSGAWPQGSHSFPRDMDATYSGE